jgi:hypothetical protein
MNFDRTIIVRDNQGREASLGEIIDAAVKEANGYWYLAITHLPTDSRNSVLSTRDALIEHQKLLTPPTEGEGNKE